MLEFYVNYTAAGEKRMQAGPFTSAEIADRERDLILRETGISLCFLGVTRDETRTLVNDARVTPFSKASIHAA